MTNIFALTAAVSALRITCWSQFSSQGLQALYSIMLYTL